MKNIKKMYIKISLLFLIFFSNSVLITVLNNNSSELNTPKNQSPKLSNEDITIITPENRTYTNSTCDYYFATHGFDYDAHGAKPTGWDIIPYPSTSVRVIDEIEGHKKVVEFQDLSSSHEAGMEITFDNITEGAIEYWVRSDDVSFRFFFEVYQDDTMILRIRIYDEYIDYYVLGYTTVKRVYDNTWYHIKVDISTLSNSADLYIDGILEESGPLFGSYMNKIRFDTNPSEAGLAEHPICYYVDAVGFSWDPSYTIGDNLNEGMILSYETDKDLNWTGYSLDGQANKTIIGNTTLIPMPEDGLHTIQVFGMDILGTVYCSAIRHFTIGPLSINSPENRTYTNYAAITGGYYRATYGFENDAYKADPADWITEESPFSSVRVIDELGGHKNVVEFWDASMELLGSKVAAMETTFDNLQEGIIEFWIRGFDVSYKISFEVFQDSTLILRLRFYHDDLQYYDGSYTNVMDVDDNTWYHIKVNISVSDNSAELFVNGISKKNGSLIGSPSYMNKIYFHTNNKQTGLYYVDAVGFSWDPNYNIGDNFFPNGMLLDIDKNFEHDWIGYSLDGQSNITILGDTAFPVLEEGHHTIQVFANDSSGTIYESEIRHFHIYWNATVPDAPMNVNIQQGIGYIYLSWDTPSDNNAPIKRYNIYRGNTTGGYKELIAFTNNSYYNDTNAGNYIGHRFYYLIRAENVLGESADSEEVSGKAYDAPFVDWLTPEENARVVFPANKSDPYSLWVKFNFTYETEGFDYEKLFLNDIDYGNVSNKNSLIFEYNDSINGNVNATLFGYQVGNPKPIVQYSRNFTFAKIMVDVIEIYDMGMNNTGKQLYLILHDPHGDHSFSGFSEITSFSTGVSTHVSNVETVKVRASIGLFGIGGSASARIQHKITEDYDFRLETTEISAFTSNQASDNPDYIGPGRGDIYWGEVWIVNWVLKAHNRTYYGETEWVNESPILEYGIIRDAEALLNDNYAPENWKELNPVHNDWLGVDWIKPKAVVGGVPWPYSYYTKTTEAWGFSTELKIDTTVSVGLFGFGTKLKLHFEKRNYNYQNETKEYKVSYTVHDDDPTDFIVQDVGIDKRFGTYIFRPYSLTCNTSNPLEHDTFDYIPPLIDFPDIDLDSNDDNHFPCPDDSPIVTVDIFDEGGIQQALIFYSINDGAVWDYLFLSEQVINPGTWEGIIPAQEFNTTVLWYIIAWDNEGGKSIRKDALGNPFEYTVIKKPKGPEAIPAYPYSFTILIMISAMVAIIINFHKKRDKNK